MGTGKRIKHVAEVSREDIMGMSFFDIQISVKHKKSSFKSWNVLTMVSYLFLIERTFNVAALIGDVYRL